MLEKTRMRMFANNEVRSRPQKARVKGSFPAHPSISKPKQEAQLILIILRSVLLQLFANWILRGLDGHHDCLQEEQQFFRAGASMVSLDLEELFEVLHFHLKLHANLPL
jgi:hypothetical protein